MNRRILHNPQAVVSSPLRSPRNRFARFRRDGAIRHPGEDGLPRPVLPLRRTIPMASTRKIGRDARTGEFIPVKVARQRKSTAVVEKRVTTADIAKSQVQATMILMGMVCILLRLCDRAQIVGQSEQFLQLPADLHQHQNSTKLAKRLFSSLQKLGAA